MSQRNSGIRRWFPSRGTSLFVLMMMRNFKTQSWRGGATARLAAAIALLALIFGLAMATGEEARAARAKASELQKPSFVLVQT